MIAKDIVQFLCFGAICVAYGHGTDLTQDVWSAVGKSKQRIASFRRALQIGSLGKDFSSKIYVSLELNTTVLFCKYQVWGAGSFPLLWVVQ